jgi:hypothetical protein
MEDLNCKEMSDEELKEGVELSWGGGREYRVRSVRGKRVRNGKEEYKNIPVTRCAWKRVNGKEECGEISQEA